MNIYFFANFIGIKLDQDRSDCNDNSLVICDGIGEYNDSGKIAELVTNQFNEATHEKVPECLQQLIDEIGKEVKSKNIIGGTTFISAIKSKKPGFVKLAYLGNGGIIRLQGNFYHEIVSDIPYFYTNILLPHVNGDGALLKHISHDSGERELLLSEFELNLNSTTGDIIFLFSDGIESLENQFIIQDDHQRYWRYESQLFQLLMKALHQALLNTEITDDLTLLFNKIIKKTLLDFQSKNLLEDDASVGIVITSAVFDHYKTLRQSQSHG
jgi:serine/threonine protein phosphatase PrpC